MNKKERKKKIFDEIRAEQPRYDETTRLLEERLARARNQPPEAGGNRGERGVRPVIDIGATATSKKQRKQKIFEEMRADQARYDETTRLLRERIERLRDLQERRRDSS